MTSIICITGYKFIFYRLKNSSVLNRKVLLIPLRFIPFKAANKMTISVTCFVHIRSL